MADCKGLERLKRVSWQRGLAVGTHSTFHIVKDSSAGKRYVVKTMFCPSEVIRRRLESQVEALMKLRTCPYLMPIQDYATHAMFPGLGNVRKGSQMFVFIEHMRGWTLRYRLAQRLHPNPHQIYLWLKMICTALVKLHKRNIVHDNVR